MNEQQPNSPQPKRSISEISHLFLSSVRDRQTGGQPRPTRLPPKQPSIDLTPEEYAQVFGGTEPAARPTEDPAAHAARIPPITALITLHLNGTANDRIREYARHLAANGERIGVLEVDGSEFRLTRYERSIDPNEADPTPAQPIERFDHRFMAEALEEMSWDLDRWLLVLPSLRSPEARGLLREVDHWAVLSTCDHDGVVSCYRTLKGLSGGLDESRRPAITLALLDAPSEAVSAKVFRKLRNVCLQFLGIELQSESAVRGTRAVAEHVVVNCRPVHDKAQLAAGMQWVVVEEFLARARAQAAEEALRQAERQDADEQDDAALKAQIAELRGQMNSELTDVQSHRIPLEPAMPASPPVAMDDSTNRRPLMMEVPTASPEQDPIDEVIDLQGDDATEQAVVAAVLGGSRGEMIECPVRAPMCPNARLAVTRERGLIVMAVARKGLRELRLIAQAYRWAIENRALIAMAVPQLAIDPHRHPKLTLIVDHADMSAGVLAPLLENDSVSVRAYRKLRWGNKTGLLLEAA
jgi:hypothetical protein